MPTDFMSLVIICTIVLVVLKLLKATAKVVIGAVVLAVIVWALINVVPDLAATACVQGVFTCLSA